MATHKVYPLDGIDWKIIDFNLDINPYPNGDLEVVWLHGYRYGRQNKITAPNFVFVGTLKSGFSEDSCSFFQSFPDQRVALPGQLLAPRKLYSHISDSAHLSALSRVICTYGTFEPSYWTFTKMGLSFLATVQEVSQGKIKKNGKLI